MNNHKPVLTLVAADDHRLFLQGLTSLLAGQDGVSLVASCEDGDGLLRSVREHQPDIVLLDLSMPGPPTEELVARISNQWPQTQVAALTMHLEPARARRLFERGLAAYISKSDAFDELAGAIEAMRVGERYISPALEAVGCDEVLAAQAAMETDAPPLSARELAVLSHAARGQTNQSIANALCISERTVRFHLANCCEKLGAKGKGHAIALAMQRRLITVG